MTKKITILLLSLLVLCPWARTDTYVRGTDLALTGLGFGPYSGGTGTDSPFDCYIGWLYAGTNETAITFNISVPETGPHKLFLNFLDYDNHHRIWSSTYNTNEITLDYRNVYSGRWSKPLLFTNAVPLTNFTLNIRKTNSPGVAVRMLVQGAFVTTNLLSTVDRDGYMKSWNYPTVMNSNTPVKGNIMHDSSFEGRGNEGWGISKNSRSNYFLANYETNLANVYHGDTSMRLTNETATYISRIYRLETNAQYTVSFYGKSRSGTVTAAVGLQNVFSAPAGEGFSNQQWLEASGTLTTNWQRYSATGYMLDYPVPEFRVTLRVTGGSATDAYIDAVQVEPGTLDTYAPAASVEFGFAAPAEALGNIYTNTASAVVNANFYNASGSPVTVPFNWRITDTRHRVVRAGTTNLTIAAGRYQYQIPHSVAQRGWFCIDGWISGSVNSGDEMQYCVLTDESGPLQDFGGHVEWLFARNPQILARLGATLARGLSTTQFGRWSVANPTAGNYVWYNDYLPVYATNGLTLTQNLGENVPAWGARLYFTVTNIAGSGFVVGETVTNSLGSGIITCVLKATNLTGNALQLSNVTGTFPSNALIVGLTSATTANTYSTAVSGTPGLPEFDTFVTAFANNYGTNIPEVEIWNEPNQDGEIPKPNGSLAFYAEIVNRVVAIYKSIAPSVSLIGMGGVFNGSQVNEVMNLLPAYARTNLARLTIHLYDPNGNGAWAAYTNTTSWGLPLDNGETGAYSKSAYDGYNTQRKTEGFPVSHWNDFEWRIAACVEAPKQTMRNVGQSRSGGLQRYIYYDNRYSSFMPESAGIPAAPATTDYDDTVMAKGVVAQSLMRMFRDYQGTGPLTLRNSNVWCYGWSNAIGQSAFMVWGTNEAPWTLTYTNPGASSKFVDAFATPISVHVPTLAVTRMPRFLFTDTVWETMTNLLSGASITVATDTEPPTCRITICPTGRVETNSDVIIKFMGTDQQTMPSEGDPELLKFTWRLLGYSDTWTTPQALLSTVYSGLPAGHYVFQVRSVDNAGNYSPVDSRSFSVGTNFVRTTKVTAGAATAGTFYVGYPGVAFVTVSADDASQHDLRITQDLGTGAYTLYVNQAVSSGVAEDILLQAQDLTNHRLLLRLLGGSYAPELEQTNTVGTPSSIVLSDGFRGHALSAHFDGTNYLISVAQ